MASLTSGGFDALPPFHACQPVVACQAGQRGTPQGLDRKLRNKDRRRHILLAIVRHTAPPENCRPVAHTAR
ncbi:uncharacterized [Tachysurus ichikawai]